MKLKQSLKERFQRSSVSSRLLNIARRQICVFSPPPPLYSLDFRRKYRSKSFYNPCSQFGISADLFKFNRCNDSRCTLHSNRSSLDSGNGSCKSVSRRALTSVSHTHVKGKCVIDPDVYNELVTRKEPIICRSLSDCGEVLQTVTVLYPRRNCDFDLEELDDFDGSNGDFENIEIIDEVASEYKTSITLTNADGSIEINSSDESDGYSSGANGMVNNALIATEKDEGCATDESSCTGRIETDCPLELEQWSLTCDTVCSSEHRNSGCSMKHVVDRSPSVKGRRALRYEALGAVFENIENHCSDIDTEDKENKSLTQNVGNNLETFECCSENLPVNVFEPDDYGDIIAWPKADDGSFNGHGDQCSDQAESSDIDSDSTSSSRSWRRRQEFTLYRARKRSIRRRGVPRILSGTIDRLSYSRKLSKNLASLALLAASPETYTIIDPSEWSDSDRLSFGWSFEDDLDDEYDETAASHFSSYNELQSISKEKFYNEEDNDADCSETSQDESNLHSTEKLLTGVTESEGNNLIDELEIPEETREYPTCEVTTSSDGSERDDGRASSDGSERYYCTTSSDESESNECITPDVHSDGWCTSEGFLEELGGVGLPATCCHRPQVSSQQSPPVAACESCSGDCESAAADTPDEDYPCRTGLLFCDCFDMPCKSSAIPIYQKRCGGNANSIKEKCDTNNVSSTSNVKRQSIKIAPRNPVSNKPICDNKKVCTFTRNKPLSFGTSTINKKDESNVADNNYITVTRTSNCSLVSNRSLSTSHNVENTSPRIVRTNVKLPQTRVSLSSLRNADDNINTKIKAQETSRSTSKTLQVEKNAEKLHISTNKQVKSPALINSKSLGSHKPFHKNYAEKHQIKKDANLAIKKFAHSTKETSINEKNDRKSTQSFSPAPTISRLRTRSGPVSPSVSPLSLTRNSLVVNKTVVTKSEEMLDKVKDIECNSFSRISSTSLEESSRGRIVHRVMSGNGSSLYKGNANQAKGTPPSGRQQFYQNKSKNYSRIALGVHNTSLRGSTDSCRTNSPVDSGGTTPVGGSLNSLDRTINLKEFHNKIPNIVESKLPACTIEKSDLDSINIASRNSLRSSTKTNALLRKIAIDKTTTRSSYRDPKNPSYSKSKQIGDGDKKSIPIEINNEITPANGINRHNSTISSSVINNKIISKLPDNRLNSLPKTTHFGTTKMNNTSVSVRRSSSLQSSKPNIKAEHKSQIESKNTSQLNSNFTNNRHIFKPCSRSNQEDKPCNKHASASDVSGAGNTECVKDERKSATNKFNSKTCESETKSIMPLKEIISKSKPSVADDNSTLKKEFIVPIVSENFSCDLNVKNSQGEINIIPTSCLNSGILVCFKSVCVNKSHNPETSSGQTKIEQTIPKNTNDKIVITHRTNFNIYKNEERPNHVEKDDSLVKLINDKINQLDESTSTNEKNTNFTGDFLIGSDTNGKLKVIPSQIISNADGLQERSETTQKSSNRTKNNTIVHMTGENDPCNVEDGRVIVRVNSEPFIAVNNQTNDKIVDKLTNDSQINFMFNNDKYGSKFSAGFQNLDGESSNTSGHFESIISTFQKVTSKMEDDIPHVSCTKNVYHFTTSGKEHPLERHNRHASISPESSRDQEHSLSKDDISQLIPSVMSTREEILDGSFGEMTEQQKSIRTTRQYVNNGHIRSSTSISRQALAENRLKKNLSKSREFINQLELEHKRLKGDDPENEENCSSIGSNKQHDLEYLLKTLSTETALTDNYSRELEFSYKTEFDNIGYEKELMSWRPPKADNRYFTENYNRPKKETSDGRHLFAFLQKKNKISLTTRHGITRYSCNEDIRDRPLRGRSISPAGDVIAPLDPTPHQGPAAHQRSLSLPKTFLADKYGLPGFKAAIPR